MHDAEIDLRPENDDGYLADMEIERLRVRIRKMQNEFESRIKQPTKQEEKKEE